MWRLALGIGREIGIGIVVNREISVGRERSVLKWVLFGFAMFGCGVERVVQIV